MSDLDRELAQFQWKRRDTSALESSKAVIQYGVEALKSSAVINGAGAAALLAFVSANSAKLIGHNLLIGWSMGAFVLGMLISALATGASYFSQMAFTRYQENYEPIWEHPYTKEPDPSWTRRTGRFFQVLAILLVVGAYVVGVVSFFSLVEQVLANSAPKN